MRNHSGIIAAGITAPNLISATIDTTGTTLTLTFSVMVTGHAGFTLHTASGTPSLTYVSGEGTTTLTYTIGTTVIIKDTPTLDYTPGTVDGFAPLASFSGTSVTNNSTLVQLVITGQPANVAAGSTVQTSGSAAITVAIQDALGNAYPGVWAITAIIGNNPGPGVLAGTQVVVTNNGTATFNDLSINATGSGYTLIFQCTGLSLSITSSTFNVTGSGATIVNINSTGNATTDGATLLAAITGASSNTNIVIGAGSFATGNNNMPIPSGVSLIGQGAGVTIVSNTKIVTNAHASIAIPATGTITNLTIDISTADGGFRSVGNGNSDNATVACTFVAVTILGQSDAILIHKASTLVTCINCTFQTAYDTFNSVQSCTNVVLYDCTFSIAAPGAVTATLGRCFDANFNSTSFSTYYCTFVSTANSNTATSINAIAMGNAGSNTAHVYGGSISVSSSGTFSGNTEAVSVTGGALISLYGVTNSGPNYNDGSSTLNLDNALVITQQPTTTVHGSSISPSITVAFQDGANSTQAGETGQVQVFLNVVSGSGTLSGTKIQTASGGVVTFNDLSISAAGTYTLTFAALGMPNVTTSQFTIT